MKTPEELLKPRYKVIADYPSCPYVIGRIVTPDSTLWVNDDIITLCDPTVEKYPHLFKKLEWWEERKVEDMPQYISYVSLTKKRNIYGAAEKSEDNFYRARVFIQVKTWDIDEDGDWYYNHNPFSTLSHSSFLPHTEEEYLNQQK